MFSQTVEYALRAMVQLASDAPAASTTKQIAAKTKVPGAYLAKVLQSMRRAGLIHSRRGVGGGISLARPASKISLMEVIDAVEPPSRRSGKPQNAALAQLRQTLDDAIGEIRSALENASLGDMLTSRTKPAKRRKKRAAPAAKRKAARAAKKRS
jgi:Rrf2 family nitric oxide-sensitive transcriptional repressor